MEALPTLSLSPQSHWSFQSVEELIIQPRSWRKGLQEPPILFPRKCFHATFWKHCPPLCNMTQMRNFMLEERVGHLPEIVPVFLFFLSKWFFLYWRPNDLPCIWESQGDEGGFFRTLEFSDSQLSSCQRRLVFFPNTQIIDKWFPSSSHSLPNLEFLRAVRF